MHAHAERAGGEPAGRAGARAPGLFSRRGFNIESLAVGPTEREDRSRITIRVDCSQHSLDQVIKQLYKLIDVLKVNEMTADDVDRARAADRARHRRARTCRADLIKLAEVFSARVVDVGPTSLMFECVEHPDKLHAFEELLKPYGIKEAVRTGRVALRKTVVERARARRMRVLA